MKMRRLTGGTFYSDFLNQSRGLGGKPRLLANRAGWHAQHRI